MEKDSPVFKKLLDENEQFQQLYQAHLEYEQKLTTFEKSHYLSPKQEMERKTLQKLKLSGKDQMSLIYHEALGEQGG